MKNNPYIELVKNDPDILTTPDEIYVHKGKWSNYFGNTHPLVLEIGTGMGNFFATQTARFPQENFLGMEIRYKRIYSTLEKCRNFLTQRNSELGGETYQKNFVMIQDLGQHIGKIFGKNEVSLTYVLFPDPYSNKKKQLKHRMISSDFLTTLYDITQPGGAFVFKTDHSEYFSHTLEIIKKQGLWETQELEENFTQFDFDSMSGFEALFRSKKQKIYYAKFVKKIKSI